jgi:hypothetical protein
MSILARCDHPMLLIEKRNPDLLIKGRSVISTRGNERRDLRVEISDEPCNSGIGETESRCLWLTFG